MKVSIKEALKETTFNAKENSDGEDKTNTITRKMYGEPGRERGFNIYFGDRSKRGDR